MVQLALSKTVPIPSYTHPGKTVGGQKSVWEREQYELFFFFFFSVLLNQRVWRLEQNIEMIVIPLWFDSNKKLNYPILGTRVTFFNDFMIRHVTLDYTYLHLALIFRKV